MAWSEGMLSRSHSFWKVSILRISWDTATNIHTAKHSTFCSSSIPTLHILMCCVSLYPLVNPFCFTVPFIYILKISSRRDGRISDAALPPPSLFTTKNSLYISRKSGIYLQLGLWKTSGFTTNFVLLTNIRFSSSIVDWKSVYTLNSSPLCWMKTRWFTSSLLNGNQGTSRFLWKSELTSSLLWEKQWFFLPLVKLVVWKSVDLPPACCLDINPRFISWHCPFNC